MKAMNMPNKKEDREMSRKGRTFPGFNAEAVFYGTSNQYRHDGELAHQDSSYNSSYDLLRR